MSFMPNHAANALAAMNGTQMKPAFCSHSGTWPAAPFTMAGSPPNQPNTPAVIASGTTNCTTLTPRLPRPALMASALPFSAFGKKNEILAVHPSLGRARHRCAACAHHPRRSHVRGECREDQRAFDGDPRCRPEPLVPHGHGVSGIINLLVLCGCIGQSGGGWSHYV